MKKMVLLDTLDQIAPVDQAAMLEAQARMDRQTKPRGSLGRLEEFARRYMAIAGQDRLRKKVVVTFAADHGVAEGGGSAFPREVTAQIVYNFLNGGAANNALAMGAIEASLQTYREIATFADAGVSERVGP